MAERETDDRMVALLEDIDRWVKFLAWRTASDTITGALKTDEDRAIYSLSDGRSTREIGGALAISHDKVARRWIEWYTIGLMKDSRRYPGRREAAFRLDEFGLPLPDRARESKDSPTPG